MSGIGRLNPVNIRDVWRSEDRHFTPWLAQHIDYLNDVIGLNLQVEEVEFKIGSFEIDILATDDRIGKVIIENQYNKSDHDHLGKLLTYLTSVEASAAVWICEDPRQEHIKVIKELNKSMPQRFYMLQLKTYKIGDSSPAPMFSVIVEPSEEDIQEGISELNTRQKKRRYFWGQVLKKREGKTDLFSNRTPTKDGWWGAGAGKEGISYQMGVQKHAARIMVWLYIDDKETNKKRFDQLYLQKAEIEEKFGEELDWRRMDDHRSSSIEVHVSKSVGWDDEGEEYEKLQDDMVETLIRIDQTFKPYLLQL